MGELPLKIGSSWKSLTTSSLFEMLFNSTICDFISSSLSCLIFSLSSNSFLSFSSLAFLKLSYFAFFFPISFLLLFYLFFLLFSFSTMLLKLFIFSLLFKLSKLCKFCLLSLMFFSFYLFTQDQVQIVLKIFFYSRKLNKILDECITYVNEVFYSNLLLFGYLKWREWNVSTCMFLIHKMC